MTRARRTLSLSTAESRTIRGQVREALPSRFLEEIPGDNMDVRDSPLLMEATQLPRLRRERRRAAAARSLAAPVPASSEDHAPGKISTQQEALAALERHFGEKGRRAAERARGKAAAGLPDSDLIPPRKESASPAARAPGAATPSFRKGDKVRHEVYGAGVVLAVQRVPNDQKLTVLFSGHGRKKFLASHTPLTHLLPS
jgi:DNA helicase-2/ATP-dependent DNA helicase PcrA